mmetsp:Transcript_17064/g.46118  ORF Transcript_17064/g.46118 Transcript_17064/m.46118 type:complete len:248 (-) Transcript_17064:638-1381(-)
MASATSPYPRRSGCWSSAGSSGCCAPRPHSMTCPTRCSSSLQVCAPSSSPPSSRPPSSPPCSSSGWSRSARCVLRPHASAACASTYPRRSSWASSGSPRRVPTPGLPGRPPTSPRLSPRRPQAPPWRACARSSQGTQPQWDHRQHSSSQPWPAPRCTPCGSSLSSWARSGRSSPCLLTTRSRSSSPLPSLRARSRASPLACSPQRTTRQPSSSPSSCSSTSTSGSWPSSTRPPFMPHEPSRRRGQLC